MLKKVLVPFIGLVFILSLLIMPATAIVPGDFSINLPYFGEAVDASEKVKISWSNSAGADGYKIALRDLTTDEKLIDNKDLGNKRSYSVWLEHDHSYRVAVCAYINGEGEVWQESEFFTIPEQIDKSPEIISISVSPSNAPAGSEFVFTVNANEYTEEVTIEIDGYSIGTTSSYTTKSGIRIFTIEKTITSAGNNREVVAYALENGKPVSEVDCTITVTESAPAGIPIITSHDSGDKHTVGESLTVSWSAPTTNPDSYNIYLYYGGNVVFSKQGVTSKKITIPESSFSNEGTYSLEVYAIKQGYMEDSPAGISITVEKKVAEEQQTPEKPSEPVQPTVSPEIYSVTVSPSSAPAGSQFTFVVSASSAVKKVGVEIDGYSVGTTTTYSNVDDKHVFTITSIITSTGNNREIVAYAYDGDTKLSKVSMSSLVTVTDSPSAGVPKITSPTNGESYTVGDSVTISWSAPATNPDNYNVYLIKNGVNTYSEKGISETYVTIPSSYLSEAGIYDVTVYAVKSGYKADEPASVAFTVSQKVVEPIPEQPKEQEQPEQIVNPPTQVTTPTVINPEILKISASPSRAVAGSAFTFVVTTNKAVEMIGIEVDGFIVGATREYEVNGDKHVFTVTSRSITSPGINRQVTAYAYDSSAYTKIPDNFASTRITVTATEENAVEMVIYSIVDFFKDLFGIVTPYIPVEINPSVSTPTETPVTPSTSSLKYNAEWTSDVEDLKGNKERETALLNVMQKYEKEVKQKGKSTVIYFIEGFGKDLSVNNRSSALCVVVKDGEIVFACDESSTLPDQPLYPKTNGGDDVPNIIDGVYSATGLNHKSGKSNYPALNIKYNPKVIRISNELGFDYYEDDSNDINIHKKSSENVVNPNSNNKPNSAGCILVGHCDSDRVSEDYDRFAFIVGFARDLNGDGLAETRNNIDEFTNCECTVVIDRSQDTEYIYKKYEGITDTTVRNEVIDEIRGICSHKDMSHEDGLCPKCGYYDTSIISEVKHWSGKVDGKTNLYSSGIKSGNPTSIDTSWVDEKDNFTVLGELNDYYLIKYTTSGGNFKTRFIEKEKVIPA